ncbi:N-acetyltransferase [Breoghania sp.]|uniref:GNAT family N-acetyltransferase n=1 Tax=Breoghania sp. TaxID=2065378 RepID=UPI00260BEECE|nr:N-acetyltransferase [Breoghania sp.]MDJ0930963.1 N-acetyltransferase [Breoghania sp.]
MSEPQTPHGSQGPDLKFRVIGPNDAVLVSRLVGEAFERNNEAHIVGALRISDDHLLELVASDGTNILGQVVFSKARVTEGDATFKIVVLAPLAIRPDMQRIGTALVQEALKRLKRDNVDRVLAVGQPAYFVRFGFSADLGEKLDTRWSGPDLLALELTEGASNRLPATVAVNEVLKKAK